MKICGLQTTMWCTIEPPALQQICCSSLLHLMCSCYLRYNLGLTLLWTISSQVLLPALGQRHQRSYRRRCWLHKCWVILNVATLHYWCNIQQHSFNIYHACNCMSPHCVLNMWLWPPDSSRISSYLFPPRRCCPWPAAPGSGPAATLAHHRG